MARNGVGTYVLPAGQPVVTGTTISSTTHNTLMTDVANALTTSLASDGQTVPTANLPLGGYKITGLGAATTNGDAIRYEQVAGTNSITTSMTGLTAPTVNANPVRATDIQTQLVQAFTTAGSGTAFTLTPTPAIAANIANQRFRVKFNAAAGATPTLAVSGQTAQNLKYYTSAGTKSAITSTQVPINWLSDVEYDGTDWVVLNVVPTVATAPAQIMPISASVAANALTISASALSLDFRSATLTSGTVTTVTGSPSNLVISSGSTLGTVNAVQSRIIVIALNNAGAIELAAVNISGGNDLSETGVISTTAEGGAGAADSANVIYSTTARTNVAYRVIGYIESTQATAGTWATAPSTIQGGGGQALAAMSGIGYGQTWQNLTASRTATTTYYNTTGKPIFVVACLSDSVGQNIANATVNGLNFIYGAASVAAGFGAAVSFVVPPGASYSVTIANFSAVASWRELR